MWSLRESRLYNLKSAVDKLANEKEIPSAISRTLQNKLDADLSSGSLEAAHVGGEAYPEPRMTYRRAGASDKGWLSKEEQDLVSRFSKLLEEEVYKQLRTGRYKFETIRKEYCELIKLMISRNRLERGLEEELLYFDAIKE